MEEIILLTMKHATRVKAVLNHKMYNENIKKMLKLKFFSLVCYSPNDIKHENIFRTLYIEHTCQLRKPFVLIPKPNS